MIFRIVFELLFISSIINGIYFLFDEKAIFFPIKERLNKVLSEFWQKPLYDCITCMASFWGVPLWFLIEYLLFDVTMLTVYISPLIVLSLAYINTKLSHWI